MRIKEIFRLTNIRELFNKYEGLEMYLDERNFKIAFRQDYDGKDGICFVKNTAELSAFGMELRIFPPDKEQVLWNVVLLGPGDKIISKYGDNFYAPMLALHVEYDQRQYNEKKALWGIDIYSKDCITQRIFQTGHA